MLWLVWGISALVSIFVLANAIFIPGMVRGAQANIFNQVYLLPLSCIFFGFLYILYNTLKMKKYRYGIYVLLIMFQIILQFYLAFHVKGAQGLDDFDMRVQATYLAHGSHSWASYFSFAPNNVGATIIFSWIIKVAMLLGINNTTGFLNLFLFFCIDLASLCGWLILKRHTNKKALSIYVILCTLFLPLFITALFMYTDPLALTFIMISFYYVDTFEASKKKTVKILSLTFSIVMMCLATFCKTNAIIMLIAFLIYSLLKKHSLKKIVAIMLITFCVYGICNYSYKQVQNSYNFSIKKADNFPYNFWIALGLNNKTDGTSGGGLWADTARYPDPQTREKHNNFLIKKELKSQGLLGLLNLWSRKINIQWSIGSIGIERRVYNISSQPSFAYNYIFGNRNIILLTFSQIIYIILWFGFFVRCLKTLKTTNFENFENLSILFIIGIFFFHMLMWETMERYAYIVIVPLLMVGSMGIADTFEFIRDNNTFKNRFFLNSITAILAGCLFLGFSLNLDKVLINTTYVKPVLKQSFVRKTPLTIKAHQTISESLNAKYNFNQVVTNIPSSNSSATKISLKHNNKKILTVKNGIVNITNRPSGKYILQVSNISNKPIVLQVIKSLPMDLLQSPIQQSRLKYLDVQLAESQNETKISKIQYIMFFILFLILLGLAHIFLFKKTL